MCAKINIRNPEAFPRSPGHWSLSRQLASSQELCISNYDTILNEQWSVCGKQHRADERAVSWVIWILGYIGLFKNPQMKCCLESSEKAEVIKCRAVISWTLMRCVWLCQTGLSGGTASPSECRCQRTGDFWAVNLQELILTGKNKDWEMITKDWSWFMFVFQQPTPGQSSWEMSGNLSCQEWAQSELAVSQASLNGC